MTDIIRANTLTSLSNDKLVNQSNKNSLEKSENKVEADKNTEIQSSSSESTTTNVNIPESLVKASSQVSPYKEPNSLSFGNKLTPEKSIVTNNVKTETKSLETSNQNIVQTVNELKKELNGVTDPFKKQALMNSLDTLVSQYNYLLKGGNENQISVFLCLMDKVKSSVNDIKNGSNVNLDAVINKNNEITRKIAQPDTKKIDEFKSYLGESLTVKLNQVIGMRSDITGVRDTIWNIENKMISSSEMKNSGLALNTKMYEMKTALSDKVTDTEFRNFNSLISKINYGSRMSLDEISNLKQFLNKVNTSNVSGLSPDTKQKLEKLETLVNNVERDQLKYEANVKIYKASVDKVSQSLNGINIALNSVPESQRGHLTSSLRGLNNQYQDILKEGNPVKIALFSRMVEREYEAIEAMRNGKDVDLGAIAKDHDRMMKRIVSTDNQPTNEELKEYLGPDCYSMIESLVEQHNSSRPDLRSMSGEGHFSANSLIEESLVHTLGEASASSRGESLVSPTKADCLAAKIAMAVSSEGIALEPRPSGERSTGRSTHKPVSLFLGDNLITNLSRVKGREVRELFEKNPAVAEAFNTVRKSMQQLEQSTREMNKSYETLKTSYRELQTYTKQNFSIDIDLDEIFQSDESDKSIHDMIESQIREAIKFSRRAEEKLNLEINANDASIVPLLEKFRAIISDLDIQTRKIIQNNLEKQMLDYYNLAKVKENKDRNVKLDQAWNELMNVAKNPVSNITNIRKIEKSA